MLKFQRLADQTAAILPDYASERHKEPRSLSEDSFLETTLATQ